MTGYHDNGILWVPFRCKSADGEARISSERERNLIGNGWHQARIFIEGHFESKKGISQLEWRSAFFACSLSTFSSSARTCRLPLQHILH